MLTNNRFGVFVTLLCQLVAGSASSDSLLNKGVNPMTPAMNDRLEKADRFIIPSTPPRGIQPFASIVQTCAVWGANPLWTARPLKLCFADKNAKWKEEFVRTARLWIEHDTGLIDFGTAPDYNTCGGQNKEQIRVGFREMWEGQKAGNWGCVGSYSRNERVKCGQSEISLNINPETFDNDAQSKKFQYAVLHEMGHALGFEHEHQHPGVKCWDNEIVHEEAMHAYGQSKPVLATLFGILTDNAKVAVFDYDQASVMKYYFFPQVFKGTEPKVPWAPPSSPKCFAPMPAELSIDDKALVKKYYPSPPALPAKCNELPNEWQLSGIEVSPQFKREFGAELTAVLSAGVDSETRLARGMPLVKFTLKSDSLGGGVGAGPVVRPYSTPQAGTATTNGADPDRVTDASDCTPEGLQAPARCTLSADGGTLELSIGQ